MKADIYKQAYDNFGGWSSGQWHWYRPDEDLQMVI